MAHPLSDEGLDVIFREARTHSAWLPKPVDDDAKWASARIAMSAWAGQKIRIVIGAADGANDTRVEAAVDDLRIERP